MYRKYEDPVHVGMMLEEAEAELQRMIEEGADEEATIDQQIYIHELRDRERFAWDDDEYDSLNASDYWYEDLAW